MTQPINRRLTTLSTPAGNKPAFTAGTGFTNSNVNKCKVFGSFLTNGASDPVASSNRGDPFSVVLTSTGLYTVQLGGSTVPTKYAVKQFLSLQVTLGKGAAGVVTWAFIGLVTDSAGTFQIRLENVAGAVVNLAAGTDNRVFFEATYSVGAL